MSRTIPKPAWRGIVDKNGTVWAWPAVLMTHSAAFREVFWLSQYRARWRQWDAGAPVDFDPGTSTEDRELVNDWIARNA